MEAILTPPPVKDYIENDSRLEHGIQITSSPEICKMDSRELTLPFLLRETRKVTITDKYSSFVSELVKGKIALKIPALGKIYNLYYLSCGKYGSYGKCRGKFMVKLKEPNPGDRKDIV